MANAHPFTVIMIKVKYELKCIQHGPESLGVSAESKLFAIIVLTKYQGSMSSLTRK